MTTSGEGQGYIQIDAMAVMTSGSVTLPNVSIRICDGLRLRDVIGFRTVCRRPARACKRAMRVALRNELLERLCDEEPRVRLAAVNKIARVARGDSVALGALVGRLDDAVSDVHQAALGALSNVTTKGSLNLITAVLARLEDDIAQVRISAIIVLTHVSDRCNEDVVKALTVRLEDQVVAVRVASMEAFAKLVRRGDENARSTTFAQLTNQELGMRVAAMQTLASIAEKTVTRILEHFVGQLDREDVNACHAVTVISTFVGK